MTRPRSLPLAPALLALTATAACGGKDDPTPPDVDPAVATQAIFDRSCKGSTCHVNARTPGQELDLSASLAFADLIGIPAGGAPALRRVTPGQPDQSYLLCKLDPGCAARVGDPMPIGGELTSDDLSIIRAWIAGLDANAGDKAPPTFAGLTAATSAAETSATLTWAAASDNATPAAGISYRVFAGTAPGGEDFGTPAATVKGQTMAILSGLSAGRTYYFVVRAADKAGNTDANTVERSTRTADLTAPMFAGLATATSSAATSVTLTWAAATDNGDAPGAIRYRVYVATAAGGQNFMAPALTTAPGATMATVTGLTTATRYFFVVRALDSANNEETNTVERNATTLDNIAPTFGGATGATFAPNSITLTWTAGSDNVTPQNQLVYLIYQSTTPGGESFAAPTYTSAPGATSFIASGLLPSTRYYFVVRARDAANNTDTNTVEVNALTPDGSDTVAPTFAGAASATAASATAINLSWAAATDNVTASGSMVYLIYQANTAGGESFTVPTFTTAPGATSFAVTGLAPQTQRFFVVRARDQAGNMDTNTQEVSATTTADTTPPVFAGATSATTQSSSAISLAWSAATDDVTPQGQIVYLIYRATTPGGESFATPTYTTGPGATSFLATGLTPGTQFYFVVRARDATNNIDTNTAEVTATTTAISFATNVQPIFAANCASIGCHSGAFPAQGLDLSSASNSYASLVNVLSQQCTSDKRVAPGSPSTSYLMWKLEGTGPCFQGSQMPKGAAPLSAADQATISAWIMAGAPNN